MREQFFLTSDGYISDQIIDRVNKVSTSIIENGLYVFSNRMLVFWTSIWARIESRTDRYRKKFDVAAITLDEFFNFLVFYVCA